MHRVEEILTAIKSLRVQGAERVAYAGALALLLAARDCPAEAFKTCLEKAAERIRSVRSTEPHLHAYLTFLTHTLPDEKNAALRVVEERFLRVKQHYETREARFAAQAEKHLPKGKRIATHCHSTSVISVIKALQPAHVFASETRPKYQGRMTAQDLATAGIPVTLRVDSAMHLNVKDADMILIGADAVTREGVVNKIGTRILALLAALEEKPVYVIADVFKRAETIPIEHRPAGEVWPNPPRGVVIDNPAFDITPLSLITGMLTLHGLVTPTEYFTLPLDF